MKFRGPLCVSSSCSLCFRGVDTATILLGVSVLPPDTTITGPGVEVDYKVLVLSHAR
jgi:hypothetical protein